MRDEREGDSELGLDLDLCPGGGDSDGQLVPGRLVRTKVWWARYHGHVILASGFSAAVLAVSALAASGAFAWGDLATHEAQITVGTKLVSTALLLVGGVAGYFRFFRGRTLSPRLKLEATVDVFPATRKENLHIFRLTAENVGAVAVWKPKAELHCHYHRKGLKSGERECEWDSRTHSKKPGAIVWIDPGEDEFWATYRWVKKEIVAVSYHAKVIAHKSAWHIERTASNKLQ